jgi:hypothetical protein
MTVQLHFDFAANPVAGGVAMLNGAQMKRTVLATLGVATA